MSGPETRAAQERLREIADRITAERARSKTCTRCGQTKPRSEFGPHARRSDGLDSWCRTCHREDSRRWRAENPGAVAARNAERRLPDVTRTCEGCGTTFTGRPNRRWCSRRCGRNARERARYHRLREEP
jgi:hypothetical protein